MNTANKQAEKGFTIIEVVLVLAIAGLIFLMVFIALPSLQRTQRDTQRKQDLSRVAGQMDSYKSATRGAIPTNEAALQSFIRGYLKGTESSTAGSDYADPQTGNYKFKMETKPTELGQIGYYPGKSCDGQTESGVANAGAREYAFTMMLEGQSAPFCVGTSK